MNFEAPTPQHPIWAHRQRVTRADSELERAKLRAMSPVTAARGLIDDILGFYESPGLPDRKDALVGLLRKLTFTHGIPKEDHSMPQDDEV